MPRDLAHLAGQSLEALPFGEIWGCDFEFVALDGERPRAVCMVAREYRSGRELRLWEDELRLRRTAPFRTDDRAVFVAYFASAELGCFLALGWPLPTNVIDLFAEFRATTNGTRLIAGNSLLGALTHFGLSAMGAGDKDDMRQLIMSGGPWSGDERRAILDYCAEDVAALGRLLTMMATQLVTRRQRLGHVLLRGAYMGAVATMEHNGIPIDTATRAALQEGWDGIQDRLIAEVDRAYGVYDGRVFRMSRFAEYLARQGIAWPRHESGALCLDDDTFGDMARRHPELEPLRQLRRALGELRVNNLAVGSDGRNRTLLSPFRSKTGRNQPSNSRFSFGTASWLRGQIQAPPGSGIAYLDFSSQEIAIAAALSGDKHLWEAYASGDPYMAFAIQAGLAPPGANKATHGDVRRLCKAIVLGVQYGMSAFGMAQRAGVSRLDAEELLRRHRETYRVFWRWVEDVVEHALLGATLTTPYGWEYRVGMGEEPNARSLQNWPMQSAGADMMRLACIEAVRRGVRVCAPVHDAILIEAPLDQLEVAVETMRQVMIEASGHVLGGDLRCRVDAEVYPHPKRFMDAEKGAPMWNRVMRLLGLPEWWEETG